jgi:hypothetical protein
MEVLEYYVVYDGYTNDLISKHATKKAAEKQLMKLIDEGKYEEVGLSSYSTWLKNDKIYYPKKYQEDVFGRMGDIFRPMAKGGTMNPFSVKEKKVGNTKRFVIENKSTGISFGRFKNRKDAEQYLDTHYLAQGGVTNTFDNIFLGNGFKKVKSFGGVRFFQKGDIFASVDDKNRIVEITKREGQVIYRGYSIKDVIDVVNEKLAKGGMTTFQDKVNAISKRLEGTKVPKRLEKDYGKRYNKEEAIQAGRRIAGSIVAKNKYNNGGTVGDSPYTDAEIREALQNFFAVPIKIVTNNNAYFAVKSVPYYKDGEHYFDSSYSYKNEEVWHYNYDTFESQISYIRTPKEHINEDDSYQIEAYYPIKKGYELKGVDVLEDGDLDYFKR